MNPQEQFLKWLSSSQADLAGFIAIIKKFLEQQKPAVPAGSGDGPQAAHIGQEHALTTVGLSFKELDALTRSAAEADVKDRAIEYAKAGLAMIVGGAL